jgi:hypothetical protein
MDWPTPLAIKNDPIVANKWLRSTHTSSPVQGKAG